MNHLDNLIKVVIGEFSEQVKVWEPIPYPQGFTKYNSQVIILDSGSDENVSVIFKINNDRERYCVTNVGSYKSHIPIFIFIHIK